MARPTKQGIDYFPLDVDFDEKAEMYLIEKEANGLAVLVTTWQLIYKNEGYFIRDDNDLYLMIKKRISLSIEIIKDCIKSCLDRNLFDLLQHKQNNILTSIATQKRYFNAAEKKKQVNYNPEYLLIDISDFKNLIKVGTNSIDSNGNATNVKEEVNVNVNEEVKKHIPDKTEIIFNSWNAFADMNGLSKLIKLTDKRAGNIKSRLQEKEFDFDMILEKIKESKFLLGDNERGWRIDFDFIIGSKNNYLKILEGKYNNGANHGTTRSDHKLNNPGSFKSSGRKFNVLKAGAPASKSDSGQSTSEV